MNGSIFLANRLVKESKRILAPEQRCGFVGKSRSGKTTFATTLSTLLVPQTDTDWQVWWIDTKGDPRDIARLKRYGYVSYGAWSADRLGQMRRINRIYFRLVESDAESIIEQAQRVFRLAMERGHVLLVADEYTQVVMSMKMPGRWLGSVFRQGGGLNVGIIGQTQEPVYVPRQLLSQATHVFFFDLFYEADIKYIRGMFKDYIPPADMGDPHGFYWGHTEGSSERRWMYFKDQQDFLKELKLKPPKETTVVDEPAQSA